MTDRLLVFSNPEVQEHLREDFIPVAADDWYQRRRQDAVGEFFRKVADQGPRSKSGTRQGHYVFTAQGKLLGYNNNRGPVPRLKMMREALEKWNHLSKDEQGGTVEARGEADENYHRSLPENVQVVKVSTRVLEEKEGALVALDSSRIGTAAAVDHLWIRSDEVKALNELLKKGGGAFPEEVAMRIARYHLNDSTRGEALSWRKEEVRSLEMTVGSEGQLGGKFKIESKNGKMGYEGTIRGRLSFDDDGSLSIFECLVLGEHWGEGPWTKGARPGRSPLGQVMQLTPATQSQDQIPPQGMRGSSGYWSAN